MCMMVYIASDYPLPLLAWDKARPRFNVEKLTERDEAVRRHFSKPYAYYVGAHEGCGCGFQCGLYPDADPARVADANESRRRLSEYLSVALQHQASVELFACWDGDQGEASEHYGRIRPQDLPQGTTFFLERELLLVVDSLLDDLLESDTAFQALVAKSKASPRKPFAAGSGA
jgi:hypothetical protein